MHDSSIIDLHCHSTASDGTYAPKEVAALAQKIGLSAIALTDHDTIDGLAGFQAAGNALGIEAIAGICRTLGAFPPSRNPYCRLRL